MKVYYIAGLLFAGIFGAYGQAHAGETQFVSSSTSVYTQTSAYTRNVQAVQQSRRIVRVEQQVEPRAVMIDGTYMMSDMAQLRPVTRVVKALPVPSKLKTTPNLYRTTSQSSMPVMFTRDALQAR